jgi:hypothetical protein
MGLRITFRERLSAKEMQNYNEFVLSPAYGSIYQSTYWNEINGDGISGKIYFWDGEVPNIAAGVFLIHEKPLARFGEIHFGPVVREHGCLVEIFEALIDYASRHFHWLRVALPYPISTETERLERIAIKKWGMKFDFGESNWATLKIGLNDKSLKEIYSGFRKSYKPGIRKAERELNILNPIGSDQVDQFSEIFCRMHVSRGITINATEQTEYFISLWQMISLNNLGDFYLTCEDEKIIGGMIFIRSGNRYIYYKGAADPEKRKHLVLHAACWKAIQYAHAHEKIDVFDLGGYNIFVDETDQIYSVNRFKEGFTKEIEFFPKTQYYIFSPLRYQLYKKSRSAKNRVMHLYRNSRIRDRKPVK